VAIGTLTVTLPSLPVIAICVTPPIATVTILPATGVPAKVSLVVMSTLSPTVALVGGETSAGVVAAGVVPPIP
jgi:hypothetical protein